jgi:hypothetical protein
MAETPTWIIDADLPDLDGTWKDSTGAVIDLTAYTFTELRIGKEGQAALLTKTSGVTFAATDPNVTVAWTPGELAVLAPAQGVQRTDRRHPHLGQQEARDAVHDLPEGRRPLRLSVHSGKINRRASVQCLTR